MKIERELWLSHDNGVVLGQIVIDNTWNKAYFKPGKRNGALGGSLDSDDMRKIAKMMDGIKCSVFAESLVSKIRKWSVI